MIEEKKQKFNRTIISSPEKISGLFSVLNWRINYGDNKGLYKLAW